MRIALSTRVIAGLAITAVCLLLTGFAHAGVDYADPVGDWRYTYDGTFNAGVVDSGFVGGVGPAGSGTTQDREALDGTWRHDQGSKWDGTAPGDPLSNPSVPSDPLGSLTGRQGTSPGGAGAYTEDGTGTTYIRVQDPGNPDGYGWVQGNLDDPTGPDQPINTNRRVYFGHDITQDGPVDNYRILTITGTTVSFRARIPNNGKIDAQYQQTFVPHDADFDADNDADGQDFLIWQRGFGTDAGAGNIAPQSEGNANGDQFIDGDDLAIWQDEFGTTPGVVPWFENAPHGHGKPILDNRGMVNVVQYWPGGPAQINDTAVTFSLVTSQDIVDFCSVSGGTLCSGGGSGGLIMNNLNGDVPSNLIGSDGSGALKILEIPDNELNEWNEFWITLENNGGAAGNILVKVYRNGSTTATEFNVTLTGEDNATYKDEGKPFLEFGVNGNQEFGSVDLDFISYQLGVIAPTPATLAGAATVPEPSCLVLLALGLLTMGTRTVRRLTA